jgi:endogenous inhibitor of DNA gyrase (YacG/DUF329 family)
MVRAMTCPVCGKEVPLPSEVTPFCSERCRQIDFFRWNDGRYKIVEPLDPTRMQAELSQDQDEPDEE